MRPSLFALIAALLLAMPGLAQTENTSQPSPRQAEVIDPMAPRAARDVTLEEFLWIARPLIVFADSPADPRVREQLQMLADRPDVLAERDVVIIVDTDPSEETALRRALRPRGFSLVIVQKDGRVGLRRPSPRDVREIVRGIDNFALRQEEMQIGQ
ncbi:DUF4174 domain-containing protein [Rhodobacterales bacterium LSUCC0031]|nr:DUF4174 domain-containing protein [Rhodobacterales bacterium LSUCC0031]